MPFFRSLLRRNEKKKKKKKNKTSSSLKNLGSINEERRDDYEDATMLQRRDNYATSCVAMRKIISLIDFVYIF
jgi:hypothetical protein